MTEAESMTIANVLRPFAVLLFFVIIVIPLRMILERLIPPGRLKALLFRRIS